MSIAVSSAVWERSACTGTDLLVLLAIAEFASDEGTAYPSVATLAKRCRMSARNVNLILARLRSMGELEVHPSAGPGGVNVYCVTLPAPLNLASPPLKPASPPKADTTPLKGASPPLKPASSTPEVDFIPPLKPASDKPSLNRKEPSEKKNTTLVRDREQQDLARQFPELVQGIEPQLLVDFQKLRKQKRAPVTETVLRDLQREAKKAGMTVAEAMTMCCARGWQGFNADWVQRGARGSGSPSRHNRFDAPGYYDDVTDNTNQQGNLV